MVGPNGVGLLNTALGVSLTATFAPSWPPSGGVSMLSQSGALARRHAAGIRVVGGARVRGRGGALGPTRAGRRGARAGAGVTRGQPTREGRRKDGWGGRSSHGAHDLTPSTAVPPCARRG